MDQSGGRWTTTRPVQFHSSYAARYYAPGGGAVGYLDDYGTFHRITDALYTNYNRAYLSFSDEQDSGYTLYDSTAITASGGGSVIPVYSDPITILAQSENASPQTLAFDLDYDDDWEA